MNFQNKIALLRNVPKTQWFLDGWGSWALGLSASTIEGGAAASNPLLQAQADCTGLTIRRPANLESTARGVALFAGLQSGVIPNLQELATHKTESAQLFSPKLNLEKRKIWKDKWNEAVIRSLHWHE